VTIRNSAVVGSGSEGIAARRTGFYETVVVVESCQVSENAEGGVLANGSGTTVTLSDTTIRDNKLTEHGYYGYGIEAYGGARMDAEACQISGNRTMGVLAMGSGTTITLRETLVGDTLPDEWGGAGYGIGVYQGASLVAESCQVSGNAMVGVLSVDAGSAAELRETTVRDTWSGGSGGLGLGLAALEGGYLAAQSCEVAKNAVAGVYASHADTRVSLSDTTVQGTLPDENGELGYGLYVLGGASLTAQTCVLTENTTFGVLAIDAGTAVTLRQTIVQDTEPDEWGFAGIGLDAFDGASLSAEGCTVAGNSQDGVLASGSDTTVTLVETTVRDTRPDPEGQGGFGVVVYGGATLDAEACTISDNAAVGVFVADDGTAVELRETTIRDTLPAGDGFGGYGIQVSDGASLGAEGCEVTGSTAVGILVAHSQTVVTLAGSAVLSTKCGELQTVGLGVTVVEGAEVEASALEAASNEGPGIYLVHEGSHIDCTGCVLRANQFAGATVAIGASLALDSSAIEGNLVQENLGGGVGLYAEPWAGGPPTLTVSASTIQDNPVAGVWLSGEGSYSLSGNTIRGGEGWSRGHLDMCGDAVYARNGVAAWDGKLGLRLEGNQLRDGLGAGLFLDDASASLADNSYADNAVDLVTQGADCATAPQGFEDEAIASAELCPSYDYATCGDEYMLFLELEEPKSGHGTALTRPRAPGPSSPRLFCGPDTLPSPGFPPVQVLSVPPFGMRQALRSEAPRAREAQVQP